MRKGQYLRTDAQNSFFHQWSKVYVRLPSGGISWKKVCDKLVSVTVHSHYFNLRHWESHFQFYYRLCNTFFTTVYGAMNFDIASSSFFFKRRKKKPHTKKKYAYKFFLNLKCRYKSRTFSCFQKHSYSNPSWLKSAKTNIFYISSKSPFLDGPSRAHKR